MAQQLIGIGSSANDGTGDPLRTAFTKANDNFTELYATWADWVPTWTGFSVNPTVIAARYIIIGKRCMCWMRTSTGTSNTTAMTFTLPATAKSGTNFQQNYNIPSATNNGTATSAAVMQTTPGSNVMTCFLTAAGGAWTGSGGKGVSFGVITFEID